MTEKDVFRSSVNREPSKRRGLMAWAVGKLVSATTPTLAESPQVTEAGALPPQPKKDIEAIRLATEQTAELRGNVSRAVRQFQELREAGRGSANDDYQKDPDRVIPNKDGVPILTSVMRATIRDPRRVSVDGRDSPRGLSSNPFMGEQSKVNHISILRATRTSTDSSRPYADDRIALTVESTDERPGDTYGQGRVHGLSFVTDKDGKEYVKVTEAKYKNRKLLPADVIYPETEQMQSLVDMISAAAMDSDPHKPLHAEQPPHQAQ